MSDETVFVRRERELAQLNRFLNSAMEGKGEVCFVTGEAGTGKTALVTEFARRAQAMHPDLVVAYGQCNIHTGMGDPYLPFREILNQLTGGVEEELARGTTTEENANRLRYLLSLSGRALAEVGPDLIGLFLPGAGLVARLAAFAAEEAEWAKKLKRLLGRRRQAEPGSAADIEQTHVFEQYANVLQRLSEAVPLILVLDDLHWTDTASSELLFHLSRRMRESRLLIVGTYRPDEVELGRQSPQTGEFVRHPLEKTLAELKRYYGEILIRLGEEDEAERRGFVDGFLDTEPNQLGEGFRSALLDHTDGHPLFTIELLRDMQERGDLVRDKQGRWLEGPELDWHDLPAKVEGVIEERIGRLSDQLCEELRVGSVEGESFTAEVIARVQGANARQLFRRFSQELEKRHRLVQTQGVRQLNGQRLFLFRFSHNVFQVYLYNELSEADRICLHEDVGNALEALFGERTDEIAVQLARHFEEARIPEKAYRYLFRAGEQAAARYANAEAVRLFSRALAWTSDDMLGERWAALLARERVNDLLGERDAQEEDLAALARLAEESGDGRLGAEANLRLAHFRGVTGQLDGAIEAAQGVVRMAGSAGDVGFQAAGHLEWGRALQHQADYEGAQTHFQETISLACSPGSGDDAALGRLRLLEADGRRGLALTHESRGHVDEATILFQEARVIYQELGHRRGEYRLLNSLANLQKSRGAYENARALFLEALSLAREVGDRHSEGGLLSNLGTVADDTGNFDGAIQYHEEALALRRDIEDLRGQAISLGNLGALTGRRNDHTGARQRFEESLAIFRQIGDRWGTALTVKNLASVCLYLGDYPSAVAHAMESARIFYEIDFPRGEVSAESTLGLLSWLQGDFERSVAHCRTALSLLDAIGELEQRPQVLIHLGDALLDSNDLSGAGDAFSQALELLRSSGAVHEVVKPLAGLARVALARDEPAGALVHVEELLPYLGSVDDPYGVYLTCYHVLRANEDARGEQILATAYNLLQENAAMLTDSESRKSFLENVRVNREITEAYTHLTSDQREQ
jgi:tetratricopeptide (TPR) repeat protein